MSWLYGDWTAIGGVCGKTLLLTLTALAGLRLAPRRAIAELRISDFVVAVAVGAIIGRSATATGTSFVLGFAALATLLLVHAGLSRLRFLPALRRLMDHPVEILVRDGNIYRSVLRKCRLTEDDLHAALRQKGVYSLDEVRLVLYESKGGFTVVRRTDTAGELLPLPGPEHGDADR
ncbi:DUF421 domain-containing protein [Amycolatopsis rhizosphaerae]|uniref:DUF421 domain-containing protein n=1 Tax=Amycolatopsis rhizosphaerae TaxID=2053003 RepID=A0A557ZXQ6_9PSEU|nr:YetF domain-containing protein [Amycolatopsis rhizosphaerae]TVT16795.1 DUF421 domain-containing protein [Amycolatopsis rhizosphaerae]